jgi:hypothetical protein
LPINNHNYSWDSIDYYDLPELSVAASVVGVIIFPQGVIVTTAVTIYTMAVDVAAYFEPARGIIGSPIHYPILVSGPVKISPPSLGFSSP